MFDRFKRNGGKTDADRGAAGTESPATTRDDGDAAATRRDDTAATRRDEGGVATTDRPATRGTADEAATTRRGRFDREGAGAGVVDHETMRHVRARQREEYGGINWGAAFFGFLVAVGMAAILLGILSAAGAAFGLTDLSQSEANKNADTIGLVGGILLVAVVAIAYYGGGYVSGRMSRFDGGRQGVGSWAIGLIVTIALGVAGWLFGPEWNVFDKLGLPNVPIDNGTLTVGGGIALAVTLILSLLVAMAGGKAGERYHRKIDRIAAVD